ncbi:MAG: hypothetical protein HC906_04285 [Bacteroidales bacterium]|nr:hypothetical protein [Bacteroidales bacterium]
MGWVTRDLISYNQEDISFALMANRALSSNPEISYAGRIRALLDQNPYPASVFVPLLSELLEQENEKNCLKIS